jgi:hypothetical protein
MKTTTIGVDLAKRVLSHQTRCIGRHPAPCPDDGFDRLVHVRLGGRP